MSNAGPSPDPRWANFTGGLDRYNQPVPMTYERLAQATSAWLTTASTPDGVSKLLATSRRLWDLAWFHYELLYVATSWSLVAVEAALRERLAADAKVPFKVLIRRAEERGIIGTDEAEALDAGREVRNGFAHARQQSIITPGMAASSLASSHRLIASLYPA